MDPIAVATAPPSLIAGTEGPQIAFDSTAKVTDPPGPVLTYIAPCPN